MNLKLHFIKLSILLLVGVGILVGLFFYINENLTSFFASGASISLNMSPATDTKKVNDEFNVSVILSGQRVDGAEIFVTYDAQYFQYLKEYNATGSGFSQTTAYFDSPLIESVSTVSTVGDKKQLRLVLTSQKTLTNNTTQFALKFKAIKAGTGKIQIASTSKFSGVDSSNNAVYYVLNAQNLLSTITITSGTITPTSSVCVPKQTAPVNGVTLSAVPPTLTWSGCPGTTYYQTTVNGGGIAWTSLALGTTSYKMDGFTFRPGSTYTWSVRTCADSGCKTTGAWAPNQTFKSAGAVSPTAAYQCGNGDCSNKMYKVVPPIIDKNAEQICVAKGWGQCAVCNVGYGPATIHGWKPDTGTWSNTCPGSSLASFNPTNMEVCCTAKINTPTPSPTKVPTVPPQACVPTKLAVSMFEGAPPQFRWTGCAGTGNTYQVQVTKKTSPQVVKETTTKTVITIPGATWLPDIYTWFVRRCTNTDCSQGLDSTKSTFTIAGTTIPPTSCSLKPKGDANCDDKINSADYACWRAQYLTKSIPVGCKSADFDGKDKANLLDFTIWVIGRSPVRDQ